jgi:hypothetical protein
MAKDALPSKGAALAKGISFLYDPCLLHNITRTFQQQLLILYAMPCTSAICDALHISLYHEMPAFYALHESSNSLHG